MVGLIQIIIIMGCIYLVMKAISITQIGLAAHPENRRKATFYTIAGAVIGLAGAAFCLYLMMEQSASIGSIDRGY